MAKANETRAVNNNVLGGTTKQTSAKGPYGGGTAYNQMKTPASFAIEQARKGHTQKSNIKK